MRGLATRCKNEHQGSGSSDPTDHLGQAGVPGPVAPTLTLPEFPVLPEDMKGYPCEGRNQETWLDSTASC